MYYFNLNPVNFLIGSGIIQVFILSVILLTRREGNQLSNRLLGSLLLSVNFYFVYLIILDTNLDNLYPRLLRIPYSYLTAIGPFIYLYTRSLTESNFRISKRDISHFAPVCVEVVLQLIQIIWSIIIEELYYNVPAAIFITPIIYIAASVSVFYYLRKSIRKIQRHEKVVADQFSDLKKITLNWLGRLLSYYRLFWLVWVPFALIFLIVFRAQIQIFLTVAIAYLLLLTLTYFTYWIGLQGLLKGSVMNISDLSNNEKMSSYSHLSADEIDALIRAIKVEMSENKCYLNSTLSLRDFAKNIGKEPNLISFVLNQHFKSSFYEFVNTYRIEAVKERLANNAAEQFTLLSIALDCGFNSKTSFNRVFKEMTGITPSQYLKKITSN